MEQSLQSVGNKISSFIEGCEQLLEALEHEMVIDVLDQGLVGQYSSASAIDQTHDLISWAHSIKEELEGPDPTRFRAIFKDTGEAMEGTWYWVQLLAKQEHNIVLAGDIKELIKMQGPFNTTRLHIEVIG